MGATERHYRLLLVVPAPDIASLNPFQTLQRHRNFRLFWFGQTLSLIGTWMQSMSEGWLALELSNSAFVVGLVRRRAVASHPPRSRCTPAWSSIAPTSCASSRSRRRCSRVQAAVLWWFTWSGHITVGWLLALALGERSHRRVRDSGAAVARHRARRPRGSAGRDRAQLERLQSRPHHRSEHRRDHHRAVRHRLVLRRQRAELHRRARSACS